MPVLTSPINKALTLRGVVNAARPQLSGSVLAEYEAELNLPVPGSPSLVMQTRVLRSAMTSLLDFDYHLGSLSADCDFEVRMSLAFPVAGLKITFAEFRVDGPGIVPPNHFESSAMEPAVFRFTHGLAAGRGARRCVISTNAMEFRDGGGTMHLLCNGRSISIDIPSPTMLAPYIPPSPPITFSNETETDGATDLSETASEKTRISTSDE